MYNVYSYKTDNRISFSYADAREFNKIRHSSFKLVYCCIFGSNTHIYVRACTVNSAQFTVPNVLIKQKHTTKIYFTMSNNHIRFKSQSEYIKIFVKCNWIGFVFLLNGFLLCVSWEYNPLFIIMFHLTCVYIQNSNASTIQYSEYQIWRCFGPDNKMEIHAFDDPIKWQPAF